MFSDLISFSTITNYHNSMRYGRPGECSPEKDCLWWHWLTFRKLERKSLDCDDETSVNITIDTTLTRTITPHRLMISLPVSNHLQFHALESVRSNALLFLIRTHDAGQKSGENCGVLPPSPPYNFEPVYSWSLTYQHCSGRKGMNLAGKFTKITSFEQK